MAEAVAEAVVKTAATVDLDDATLKGIAELWTAAFPTAAGRDRFAEAVARRDATAAAVEEQLHYIYENGAVVAAARTFVRVVHVGGETALAAGRRVRVRATGSAPAPRSTPAPRSPPSAERDLRHADTLTVRSTDREGTVLLSAAVARVVVHLDDLVGDAAMATVDQGEVLAERRVLALAHVATSPSVRGRGLGAAVVRGAFAARLSEGLPEALFCTGVPGFYAKLDCVELAPCEVVYPSEGAKKFVDPSIMRFGAGAPAWPSGGALHLNGAGW